MPKKAVTKTHVPLGASTCERWWMCAGSRAASENAGPSKPSFAAAEGTAAHEVAEKALRNLIDPEAKVVHAFKPGDVLTHDGFDIVVTKEMLGFVDLYVDYVNELIAKFKIEPQHVLIEQRVKIPHKTEVLEGTADCILVIPFNRIKVIDLKYGAGNKVNAKGNKQCMYYGLGALFALPKWLRDDIDYVDVVIAQPRMGGIESATYTKEEMKAFYAELAEKATATSAPNADLNPGAWCKYCPAKLNCPAVQEAIKVEAGVDFASVNPLLPVPDGPAGLPAVRNLPPDMVSRVLDLTSMMQSWLSEVHDHAYSLLNQGVEVPGYKLVDKRSNRRWINEPVAERELFDLLGEDAYATRKILSPNQAEKILGKGCLPHLIEKPDNGKTIAVDADARECVDAEIISDFDGV